MRFRVLGPLEVEQDGRPIHLGGRRHLEVLGMLLVDLRHPVSLDRMITEVWGEGAGTRAVESLYTHISNLRRKLGKDRIVRGPGGYRLVLADGDDIDLDLFEQMTADARGQAETDPIKASQTLENALDLWRGRPFEGLEDLGALEPAVTRLNELRTSTEIARFEVTLRSGSLPDVTEVEDLCRRLPLDERPWGILMRTLYRSGRQVEALRTYRRAHDLFGEELGIEPSPWLMRIEEQILLQDPLLDGVPTSPAMHLPAYLSSFVGRSRDQALLREALRRHRLVTLTGPGGVGKTRLAVEVASGLGAEFPDGIWFIDLATVSDDKAAGPAIAAAVGSAGGVDATVATAAAALNGLRCLVILDNCEHLLATTREAATSLLTGAPDLVLLATSRVVLDLPGEHRLRLDGLDVTGDGEDLGDAGLLFLDRARSIRPDLASDAETIGAVCSVCKRLDGIPLALELAAARIEALSPPEISDLLAHRFSILVDPSRDREIHRSLEATVGWSYGLLTPGQRADFAMLGVFEGPFCIEAASAVLGCDEMAALSAIQSLVSASLIHREARHAGPTLYRLLNTLRLYARDRLREGEGWKTAEERHDRHYLSLARTLADQLLVRERPDALLHIAESEAEFSIAWDRLQRHDQASALPLAWALGNHWLDRGGVAEGEVRIRDLLEQTAGASGRWRMLGLTTGSWIAARRGSRGDALAWSREAVALAEESTDPVLLIVALNHAGQLRIDLGSPEEAIILLDRSLDEIARIERDKGPHPGLTDGRVWAQVSRAEAGRWSAERASLVRDLLYECRRHFVAVGEPEGRVRTDRVLVTMPELSIDERHRLAAEMTEVAAATGSGHLRFEAARAMATVSWEEGERRRARAFARAAVRTAASSGSVMEVGSGFLHSGVSLSQDDPDRAALLMGAGREYCGEAAGPHTPPDLERAVEHVHKTLGSPRFEEATHAGSKMTPGEAISLALR